MSEADLRAQIAALTQQLDQEKTRTGTIIVEAQQLKEQLQKAQTPGPGQASAAPVAQSPAQPQPYFITSRKVTRFRDRPSNPDDVGVREWVEDVRAQLQSRKLGVKEQAAFVIEHLTGKARQEVLGRGEAVCQDPEAIFTVLLKVFGDGNNIATLQQNFFSYRQKEDEDLLTCSLRLLEIYDRMCQIDSAYRGCRTGTLKGRLAEVVRDEGLRRELRRLNVEYPDLSFFDLRDRAVTWLGSPTRSEAKPARPTKTVTVQESSTESEILQLLKKQTEQLEKQQQQITELMKRDSRPPQQPRGDRRTERRPRTCFRCGSLDHIVKDCPVQAPTPATAPRAKPATSEEQNTVAPAAAPATGFQ